MATKTHATKKTATLTIEATCLIDLDGKRSRAAKKAAAARAEHRARVKAVDAEIAAQKVADRARSDAGLMPYEVTERKGTPPAKWYTEAGVHIWGPDGWYTTRYRLNKKYYNRVLTESESKALFEAVMATTWCPPRAS